MELYEWLNIIFETTLFTKENTFLKNIDIKKSTLPYNDYSFLFEEVQIMIKRYKKNNKFN